MELVNGQSELYEMENSKKPKTKAQTLCPNGEAVIIKE